MADIKQDRKAIILRLDPKLVEQVDKRAKDKKMTRNEWFTKMATWAVAQK